MITDQCLAPEKKIQEMVRAVDVIAAAVVPKAQRVCRPTSSHCQVLIKNHWKISY